VADARRMDVHVDVLEGAEPHVFVLAAHEQVIRHADVHAEAGGIAVGEGAAFLLSSHQNTDVFADAQSHGPIKAVL